MEAVPPLHGSEEGETAVVTLILQAGSRANAKNKWWDTALHNAAENGYAETA